MSKPQINVTPLIDVLLVLLIIFMVITPVKPSAFKARVPAEPTHDPTVRPHPDTLLVIVRSDATLQLNQETSAATVNESSSLTERLSKIFSEREANFAYLDISGSDNKPRVQRTVYIKAPRSMSYGSVAKVVDAVKMSGADPVSLQIDDLESP